jgi:hypothetical protein
MHHFIIKRNGYFFGSFELRTAETNMNRIKIKNFGPIRTGYNQNDGWMDIQRVTLFTGNQGSGKSTVAKLISTISWLEKAIMRGEINAIQFQERGRFEKHCEYQNIHEYFRGDTEIMYNGNLINFTYSMGLTSIEMKAPDAVKNYLIPKIMYVPAERNFISAVRNLKKLKGLPGTLYTLAEEYFKALQDIRGSLELPINNVRLEYQKLNDIASIVGDDFKVRLMHASSGFQSLVPLFLVSRHLSVGIVDQRNSISHTPTNELSIEETERLRVEIREILGNPNLSDQAKQIQIEIKSSRFRYSSFLNIVEEPEQNLYPISQRQILNSLLGFNNILYGNKLIMTTHSPYLINYLSLAVKAGLVFDKLEGKDNLDLELEVASIVPTQSFVKPEALVIYELSEKEGTISLLKDYNGIPSDNNRLNEELGDFNDLYAHLVDIQNRAK